MIEAAAAGTNPKRAIVVHNHIVNRVMTQTVVVAEAVFVDFKIVPVIAVQSAMTAEPHETVPVLKDAGDRVLGQAVFNGNVLKPGLPESAQRFRKEIAASSSHKHFWPRCPQRVLPQGSGVRFGRFIRKPRLAIFILILMAA